MQCNLGYLLIRTSKFKIPISNTLKLIRNLLIEQSTHNCKASLRGMRYKGGKIGAYVRIQNHRKCYLLDCLTFMG